MVKEFDAPELEPPHFYKRVGRDESAIANRERGEQYQRHMSVSATGNTL